MEIYDIDVNDIIHMLCYFTCFSETVNVIFRLTASAKWYVYMYVSVQLWLTSTASHNSSQ